MPERIPQSVAKRVPLQAYLSSDHVSPAPGKVIPVTVSKNGAAYANPSGGATNAVEIGSGSYYADLSAADVGTAGPLFVKGAEGTIDTVIVVYEVVNAHNAGFDALPAAAAEAAGGLITRGAGAGQLNVIGGKAPATLAAADVAGNLPAVANAVAANAIDAAAIAAGSITDAKFGFTSDPSAVPTGMLSGLWWLLARAGLRKFVYNRQTGAGQVYRADGTTVWTSNAITATGTAETTGAAQ